MLPIDDHTHVFEQYEFPGSGMLAGMKRNEPWPRTANNEETRRQAKRAVGSALSSSGPRGTGIDRAEVISKMSSMTMGNIGMGMPNINTASQRGHSHGH